MKQVSSPRQQSPATIRVLGGVLIAIGALLASAAGVFLLWMNQMLASAPANFTGTATQKTMIHLIVGAVGAFGVVSFLCGVFQAVTGRRSRALVSALLFTVIALLALIGVFNFMD